MASSRRTPAADTHDPRLDAYIASAPEFARPILERLRSALHAGCPAVTESLKWSHPSFSHHGILAGMAAFKAHVSFGFWKSALLRDAQGRSLAAAKHPLGRLASVRELPPQRELVRWVKQAAALNESGVTVERKPRARPTLSMPPDLTAALAGAVRARKFFAGLAPSARRDYIEWIVEAKRDATRMRRVATAVEWLAAGKKRNWKYE